MVEKFGILEVGEKSQLRPLVVRKIGRILKKGNKLVHLQ